MHVHFGFRNGGKSYCGNRRCHDVTTDRRQVTCSRCLSKIAKSDARKAARDEQQG